MRLRSLVVVGFIMIASAGASRAVAEELNTQQRPSVVEDVSFADVAQSQQVSPSAFTIGATAASESRFSDLGRDKPQPFSDRDRRAYEIALSQQDFAGLPVDLEIAQRAAVGFNETGEIESHSRGSELRLGRGLGNLRRTQSGNWNDRRVYVFIAADDEALTWAPTTRNAFGGTGARVALQDRVEIGDMQLGVTYEAGPLQASLAYVERDVSTRAGRRTLSHDENFVGFTLTLRQ